MSNQNSVKVIKKTPVVFHIGYHKTGTTWLQEVFFKQHPEIVLLSNSAHPWDDPLLYYIITTPDAKFDAAIGRNLLTEQISAAFEKHTARVFVISAERLSGYPLYGGYDNHRIAERLHSIWPEAKVLCLVREQSAMIVSVYKQLVAEGYPGGVETFLQGWHWKAPGFDWSFYEFDLLLAKYCTLFRQEQVRFLNYKMMSIDIKGFLDNMMDFIEVSSVMPAAISRVNISLPDSSVNLIRRLNYFRKTELNPYPIVALPEVIHAKLSGALRRLCMHLPPQHILSEQLAVKIREHYYESNDRLRAMTNGMVDLYGLSK